MKIPPSKPCSEWFEKLATGHPNDLTITDRAALEAHITSCKACASVWTDYQKISMLMRNLPVSDPPDTLPDRLQLYWQKQDRDKTPPARVTSAQGSGGLLLVDNDRDLVEMLTSWLKTLGYEVHRAYSGERAKVEWEEHKPYLVIIDTALKDVDALAMCRDMRHKHDALVFVITDGKDVQDEVRCLESGADDYLRKPFFPTQLLARIHALSRRGRSTLAQSPSSIITVGPICVDSLHNEVIVDGRKARLTPTESKLLHLLAVNANNVCTASQIVAHIWGFGNDGDTGLIKAHIRHLRQKVEPEPSKPSYILTVPGVGYTLIRHSSDEKYSAKEVTRALRAVSG